MAATFERHSHALGEQRFQATGSYCWIVPMVRLSRPDLVSGHTRLRIFGDDAGIASQPTELNLLKGDTKTKLGIPTRTEYRQGGTLGEIYKHWFRAKFFQQYRLFFRYHVASKVIVFAWVNDEDTKRAYESGDDAWRVFRKMLASGRPPDDWGQLWFEATASRSKSLIL